MAKREIILQWGRDLVVADTVFQAVRVAKDLDLQWGRDLVVADTNRKPVAHTASQCLQWGRDLVVADTDYVTGEPDAFVAFNGAAT